MMDLDAIGPLLERGDARDRAYVDAILRMAWARATDAREREQIGAVHDRLRATANERVSEMRARVTSGELRGDALRRCVEGVAADTRDHFVEELLGVAYPPLADAAPEPELVGYNPSGFDEIAHALDATGLAAGDTFLDIGSGAGKVVLLAALLTGASSVGVERDAALHDIAVRARASLRVEQVRFDRADIRDVDLEHADVVFMYLPFTGSVLAEVLRRLRAASAARGGGRKRFVCCGALDTRAHDDLAPTGPARSWLQVYERR